MSRKGSVIAGWTLSAVLALILVTPAEARFSSKTGTNLAVLDQGIMPNSTVTEVVEIRIEESDTSTATNPDDGAGYLQSMTVSFTTSGPAPQDIVDSVAVYRIGQPVDSKDFVFDKEFDFGANTFILRERVYGSSVFLNIASQMPPSGVHVIPGDVIWNTRAIYYVAITTTRRIKNEDEFTVQVSNVSIVHPRSADPDPALSIRSLKLRCVNTVGDVLPAADHVRSDGISVEYPLNRNIDLPLPHNYPDYVGVHPDAKNELQDIEVPVVQPAESDLFAV